MARPNDSSLDSLITKLIAVQCFCRGSGTRRIRLNRIPTIIIDDFDSCKETNSKEQRPTQSNSTSTGTTPRVYTRSYSDASIKKILEEAEHRKHEFWKLLDEHNAVIENLKRIENLEHKII